MEKVKRNCPICGQQMATHYQDLSVKIEGRRVNSGGFYQHTCWNEDCKIYGYTLSDTILDDSDLLGQYSIA